LFAHFFIGLNMAYPALLSGCFTPAAIALSLSLATWMAHAQQATAPQQLLPAQSSVGFAIKQMGVPVQGQFRQFEAQVNFDPARLATSRIAFKIDVGSASLGSREADAEMPKAVWFNVPKFPQATFQSSSIKALGGGRFEVAGQLAIKGHTREVVVPVTLTQTGTAPHLSTTATGQFAIARLAFKVGEGEWADTSMVADEVQVKFKLALSGVPKL
jgi:polyisoprenoid-binding protein YceI